MRKIFILFSLFLSVNSFAQDYLSLSLSKSYSGFNFTNSKGEKDKTIKSVLNNAYAVNYQKVFENNFFVRGELGYKEMGAYSVFKTQKITWNLKYADINIGGGYLIPIQRGGFYLGASFYGANLLSANQTIGANYYDIKKDHTIKKNDFGINVFVQAFCPLSNSTLMFIELAKSNGLNKLDPDPNQKLYNKTLFFKLGFTFQFNAPRKSFSPK